MAPATTTVVRQEDVLNKLDADGHLNSEQFATTGAFDHQKVVGVLRSLAGLEVVELVSKSVDKLVLSQEAEKYLTAGSPEVQVFRYDILTLVMKPSF